MKYRGVIMNLERMMDTMIGDRIKKFRKSQGLTQEVFCEKYENKVSIDKYRLSALENGRREKKKNPHFLTKEYENFFSELMNIDNKTFIFGNCKERHQLIKLILLNILMNGTTNPSHRKDPKVEQIPIFEFSDDIEFFRLSYLNLDNEELKDMAFNTYSNMIDGKKYSERELETRKHQIIKELQSYDDFFYNQDIFRYYKLLMDGKQCFSKQSSILLKCLFGNFEFANEFLSTVENLESFYLGNVVLRQNKQSFYIDNYFRGEGSFGSKATDWKEIGYKVFVKAFNEFYYYHSEEFLEFFEKNFFRYSYNIVSDKHIDLVFQRDSFFNILNRVYEYDQYLPNRIKGHNFSRPMIQKFALIEERSKRIAKKNINLHSKKIINPTEYYDLVQVYQEQMQDTYDIDRYLNDLINISLLFVDNDKNDT